MGATDLPAASRARSPLSARPFGEHVLLGELIGRGGMSRVYRGWLRESGHEVAVKILRDDLASHPDAVQRFVRERDLLHAVASPHVVRVHDLVVHEDEIAIVMDLVPGGHLRKAVRFPCDLTSAVALAAQIADGLAAVHASGVVHRDLKPENVLVETSPDGIPLLRLTDFGISRLVDSATLTQTTVTGTPGYLSPEVAAGGAVTAAADLYSLGIILYELCTGRQPFLADNPLVLILAHTRQEPPRPDGMPDELWDVLATVLAKDPAARPAAAELATRLRGLGPRLHGLGPCTVPDRPPVEVADPVEPSPATLAVARGQAPATQAVGGAPFDPAVLPGPPPGPAQPLTAGTPLSRHRTRPSAAHPVRRVHPAALAAAAVAVALVIGMVVLIVNRPGSVVTEPSPTVDTAPAPTVSSQAPESPVPSTEEPTVSASTSERPPPTATPTVVPGVPTLAAVQGGTPPPSTDGQAVLAIGGVTPRAGKIASVVVTWTAPGAPGGKQPVPVPSGGAAGALTATVTGLRNGVAYAFTVTVCNTTGGCSTSAPLTFTPAALPVVPTPRAEAAGLRVTVSWGRVDTKSNPNPTTCTIAVTATPDEPGAPQRDADLGGGSLTFLGRPGSTYVAHLECRTAGAVVGNTASDPVTVRGIGPSTSPPTGSPSPTA